MYTSYVGKQLLQYYKQVNEKDDSYSAKDFFDEILFPLFFNDHKHFLNVANSSFFQSVSEKLLNQGKSVHQLKLERFHRNVEEDGASLTTMVGYAAQDLQAGTSGQLTSFKLSISSEEMYSSWIGSGLAIAMGGGYSILINHPEIIAGVFKGWKFYRKYLSQTSNLKGNQIYVWNSYWLPHYLSNDFMEDRPLDNFNIPEPELCKADKWKKMGFVEFTTNGWLKIIFALSKKYPKEEITINCFKFADTNQTIGFINIYLPKVRRFYEFRDSIFFNQQESVMTDKDVESFEPFFYFKEACKMGTIGLKALEPKGLREFMPKGSVDFAQGKEFKFTNEGNSYQIFQLYQIWITAMLNKTELLQLASDVAKELLQFEKKADRGKATNSTLVENVRNSVNIKVFIENLEELMVKHLENADIFREVVVQSMKMPSDNFPLFITLIRFEHSYQKSKN